MYIEYFPLQLELNKFVLSIYKFLNSSLTKKYL